MNFLTNKKLTFLNYFCIRGLPPFALPSIALMLGIWFAARQSMLSPLLFSSLCLLVALGSKLKQKHRLLVVLALTATFFIGMLSFLYQRHNNSIITQKMQGDGLSIYACVNDINKYPDRAFQYSISLKTINVKQNKKLTNLSGNILLNTRVKPNIMVGDDIIIRNTKLANTKNNSFKEYLTKEGYAGTLFMPNPYIPVIYRPDNSIRRAIWNLKNRVLKSLKAKLSMPLYSIFSSIFLGNKASLLFYGDEIKKPFLMWGISHYLARSGLHLVIFLAIWSLILSFIPISFRKKEVSLIAICTIYFLLSWPSISFIRAFSVFIIYKICALFLLQKNLFHALTLVTFIVLIHNPITLFFLDFQLSFALSGALAWLVHFSIKKNAKLVA